MRILYLLHQFFPKHYTGTERLTLDLAQYMQRIGHSPLVVTFDRDQDQQGFVPLAENVLVKEYSYRTIPVISLRQTNPRPVHEIFDERIGRAFDKLGIECDIVHICHPMWLSSIATRAKDAGVPVVLTLTDPWLLCPRALVDPGFRLCSGPECGVRCVSNCGYDERMSIRHKEALALLSAADYVTTSSRFTASLFRENGWSKEIPIVRHSIDYRYVKPTEGSIDPGKCPVWLYRLSCVAQRSSCSSEGVPKGISTKRQPQVLRVASRRPCVLQGASQNRPERRPDPILGPIRYEFAAGGHEGYFGTSRAFSLL